MADRPLLIKGADVPDFPVRTAGSIDFARLWLTDNHDHARREAREARRALDRLHDPTTRYGRAIRTLAETRAELVAVWERALARLDAGESSPVEGEVQRG